MKARADGLDTDRAARSRRIEVRNPVRRDDEFKMLPHDALVSTGPVDHADWNYRPVLGRVQRARFRLALDLLPEKVGTLLEIGYGSGIFMPSLAERCARLLGLDVHPRAADVARTLDRLGVRANLLSADASAVPLASGSVDCVVAVSALEFVLDLPAVCDEVSRLLCRDGCFVVVTPRASRMGDLGLRVLTGKRAREDFEERRAGIIPALLDRFEPAMRLAYPPFPVALLRLYDAFRLVPRT